MSTGFHWDAAVSGHDFFSTGSGYRAGIIQQRRETRLFFLFLVFPYIAVFVTLAFWRNWWMFGIATVAMLALYGYFASRPPAHGPGVAFLADFITIPLGLGIAAGAISSIVFMATKCRSRYASALIFALGAIVLGKLLGVF